MNGSTMVTMSVSLVAFPFDAKGGSVASALVGDLDGHGTCRGTGHDSTVKLGGLDARLGGSELEGHTNA